MKNAVILASKFITKATQDKNGQRYKALVAAIKSGKNTDKLLKASIHCISCLNPELLRLFITRTCLLAVTFDRASEMEFSRDLVAKEMNRLRSLLDDYSDFLLNITSFHQNQYSSLIVDTILKKYFFTCSIDTADKHLKLNIDISEEGEDSDSQLLDNISSWQDYIDKVQNPLIIDSCHDILQHMVEISPRNLQVISERIKSACPNIYSTISTQKASCFAHNCLQMAEHLPILHSTVAEMLLNYAISLDLHSDSVDDSKEGSSSDGEDFESSEPIEKSPTGKDSSDGDNACPNDDNESVDSDMLINDPNVLLLNEIVSALAKHLEIHADDQSLFTSIISNASLLNSSHLKFVPALIYSLITNKNHGDGEKFEWLTSFLVLNIFDGQKSNVVRLNCCCLLTVLARIRFQPAKKVSEESESSLTTAMMTPPSSPIDSGFGNGLDYFAGEMEDAKLSTVTQTLLLLTQYLHCSLDMQSSGISPTFYHITNTILYIFCFRHRELLQINRHGEMTQLIGANTNMRWWQIRGGFTRILLDSRYQVLEVCTADIVQEFLKICQRFSLFYYCNPRFSTQNHTSSMNVNDSEGTTIARRKAMMMDLYYFPFDTQILDLDIGKNIKEFYREWQDELKSEGEDEESEVEPN